MARQRNYRQEYLARLARAEARGLTRKAARGHAGDILKRTPPGTHASPVYTTERGVSGYMARLGESRKAKLVAIYEDGSSSVIGGKKGGMSKEAMLRYLREGLEDFEQHRQRYRERAAAGHAAGVSLVVGFQVIWT